MTRPDALPPYLAQAHPRQMPWHIAMMAMNEGAPSPDPFGPFTYADLGCGMGLTAAMVAALHPQAEVIGLDVHPGMIDAARRMAAETGLDNLRFDVADFAASADHASGCDFVSAHGVATWMPAEALASLRASAARMLAPGGLLHLTGNMAPGWASIAPLREAARRADPGESTPLGPRVAAAAEAMRGPAEGRYGERHAAAAEIWARVRQERASYFLHEFLTDHWRPVMPSELIATFEGDGWAWIGPKIATPRPGEDLAAAEDRVALEQAHNFRDFVFRRPGALPAHALADLPWDREIAALKPGPLASPDPSMSEQAAAALARPQMRRADLLFRPEFTDEDRAALAEALAQGLKSRALSPRLAPADATDPPADAPVVLRSALTAWTLAQPDAAIWGAHVAARHLASPIHLPPRIALLLR
ncbi:MAG: class I SAM-dependent methyltransferase, partial [Pseudomonadota bacterium]